METQRGQMNEVLPWLVHWARCAGTRDFCSALAALVGPVQNIFFLTIHYFNTFVLIGQQAGPAAVLGRLYLSLCLWSNFTGQFFDKHIFTFKLMFWIFFFNNTGLISFLLLIETPHACLSLFSSFSKKLPFIESP
jgi:hypothetical protein